MEILKPSELTSEVLKTRHSGMPFIICTNSSRVLKKICDAGFKEVQINQELSKRLLNISKEERLKSVENTLKDMFDYREPIFVSGFEMLFDPRYEIDVLKFFCERARIINVAIKWPGHFMAGKLIYAKPGDPDYHEFESKAYQIRIVQ